jgi:hypothetical protein
VLEKRLKFYLNWFHFSVQESQEASVRARRLPDSHFAGSLHQRNKTGLFLSIFYIV